VKTTPPSDRGATLHPAGKNAERKTERESGKRMKNTEEGMH
jgi:hypothetical protein